MGRIHKVFFVYTVEQWLLLEEKQKLKFGKLVFTSVSLTAAQHLKTSDGIVGLVATKCDLLVFCNKMCEH